MEQWAEKRETSTESTPVRAVAMVGRKAMALKTVEEVIAFLREQEKTLESESWRFYAEGDEHVAFGLQVQAWRCGEGAAYLERIGVMPVFERGEYPEPWVEYMAYSQNGPADLRDFFPDAYS